MANGTPVTLGPWPRGTDNISVDHAVAKDALRTIVNADVLDDGTLRRRSGLTSRVSGSSHSVYSDGQALYAVTNGVLTRYVRSVAGALTGSTLRTGMSPDLPLAYEKVGSEVFYSNGSVTGKIVGGIHRPWGVERPSGQPLLTATTSGALFAGRYQVAVTFIDNIGEESGTGPTVIVSVAVSGGIQLTLIPQPVDVTVSKIRVYVSEANGDALYRYGDYTVGTTSLVITRSSTLGKVLSTQFLFPPVPGHILKAFNGRMYIGRSNLIYFTEPVFYGAVKQTNYFAFEDEIRMIEDGGVGLWVVTASRTYILLGNGGNPNEFEIIERLAYGAPRSIAVELPGGKLFWVTTQGPVVADLKGQIEDLTDDKDEPLSRITVDDHLRGSAVVRDNKGVRQVITAMGGGANSELGAQDFFDIEIIRKT